MVAFFQEGDLSSQTANLDVQLLELLGVGGLSHRQTVTTLE